MYFQVTASLAKKRRKDGKLVRIPVTKRGIVKEVRSRRVALQMAREVFPRPWRLRVRPVFTKSDLARMTVEEIVEAVG